MAKSGMRIELRGIASILASTRLIVPVHQRSFAWKEAQVSEFLDDIGAAFRRQKEDYFLGSVVSFEPPSHTNAQVLDGQQRLATTALVLASVADEFALLNEGRSADAIRSRFLMTFDLSAKTERPNLTLNLEDAPYFTSLLGPNFAAPGHGAPDSHQRLFAARNQILLWVQKESRSEKKPVDWLTDLTEYLEHSVHVIFFTVPDEADAYLIFETLNDRGLELSVQDLLKNFLLGKAGADHALVLNNWTTAIGALKAYGGETLFTDFLRHLWSSKHGLAREKTLYRKIRERLTTKQQAKDFSQEVVRNSSLYAAILSPHHEFWASFSPEAKEHVQTLDLLGLERYRAMLLAALDTLPGKEVEELLRRLVSWNVRLLVVGKMPGGVMETNYAEIGRKIREKELRTAKEVAKHVESFVPTDSDFRQAFASLKASQPKLARYYLRTLEIAAGPAQPELIPNSNSTSLTLEHILPERPGENWPEFDKEEQEAYYKRLGNMVLLQQKVNSELKSKPFSEKRLLLAKSDLLLTKEVGRKRIWTSTAIEERQARLADLALKAWPR